MGKNVRIFDKIYEKMIFFDETRHYHKLQLQLLQAHTLSAHHSSQSYPNFQQKRWPPSTSASTPPITPTPARRTLPRVSVMLPGARSLAR